MTPSVSASAGFSLHDHVRVVKPCTSLSYQDCTTSSSPTLIDATMSSLQEKFARQGHRPSIQQLAALHNVASTLTKMAEGTCPPRFHLSSLDPGVGKTSLSVAFIHQLLASPIHKDVAVMVCLSRLVEVETLVTRLCHVLDEVAVYTSDGELNAQTATLSKSARVLITTHQMVERHCGSRSFAEVKAFQYEGRCREVRIWDEAMLPGEVVTLSTDQLAALRGPCRKLSPELAEAVEVLEGDLGSCDQGVAFKMPDLETIAGVRAAAHLNEMTGDASERVSEAASALLYLAGREVMPLRSQHGVTSALDYRDTLPADLAPMVILDASGRVRHTYHLQRRYRGDLVRLKAAPKAYGNLRIHLWEKGGGKTSWSRNGEDLALGVAEAINGKPGEEWLVIHHKDCLSGKFRQRIEGLAEAPKTNLHFVHWGAHHGINDYAHVRNVILAGTLFLPELVYEGRARLAADIRPGRKLPPGALERLKRGEYADAILQGLSRASVRVSVGGGCAPCEAYIIASPKSGIRKLLPEVFPGCTAETWTPVRRKPTGKVAEAIGIVERHLEAHPGEPLMLKDLREQLGIGDRSNFRRAVRQHPDFIAALEEHGLEETAVGCSRHANAIYSRSSLFPPHDVEDEVW